MRAPTHVLILEHTTMCPHTAEPYIFTTEPFLFLAVSCRQREATQAYNTLQKKKIAGGREAVLARAARR